MRNNLFLLILIFMVSCSQPYTNSMPQSTLGETSSIHPTPFPTNTLFATPLERQIIEVTPTLDSINGYLSVPSQNTPTILPPENDYIYVRDLSDDQYLTYVSWQQQNQILTFAIQHNQETNNYPSLESKDWVWMDYYLDTGQINELTPPMSRVTNETRQQLNICLASELIQPIPTPCTNFSALFESPFSDHIIFVPFTTGDGQVWLGNIDGTNLQQIRDENGLLVAPDHVEWSSDGKWLILSVYSYGSPDQRLHFLVATDGSLIKRLDQLTGHSHLYVNGLFPKFSPDGQHLAYVGSTFDSFNQEDYGIYTLNLIDFTTRLVTGSPGLFQWAENSEEMYVLENALYPITQGDFHLPEMRITNLYLIDFSTIETTRSLIAENIPYYPRHGESTWLWSFAPAFGYIAYIGFNSNNELGILSLTNN